MTTTQVFDDVVQMLSRCPGPEMDWERRVRWWADLLLALRVHDHGVAYAGLVQCIIHLEAQPTQAQRLGDALRETLTVCEPARTLTDTGIPVRPTFVGELFRRIAAKIVPPVAEPRELEDLLDTCLDDDEAVEWLAGIPGDLCERFVVAAGLAGGPGWPALREDATAAIGVLAARVCADGLSDDARRTLHEDRASQQSFLRLADIGVDVARRSPADLPASLLVALTEAVDASHTAANRVVERMAEHAVSADLVYRMERLRACLERIRHLAGLLASDSADGVVVRAHAFLAHLCRARLDQGSVRGLLADHTRMLARRVVLHAAATGKGYITGGFAEWRDMLAAACGGGFAMAMALHAKLALALARYPAGVEWLVFGGTYATTFAWMHLAHWTLATKQPPVTAAVLAQALRVGDQPATLDLVRRLVRSQLVSVVGNLLAVGAFSALSAVIWRLLTGEALLGTAKIEAIFAAHDPLGSGVVLFAAETGVVLYLSGLLQGWLANQAQGRNLARGFARSSLLRFVAHGERRERIAAAVARNLPGLGTAVVLGFMLAALPVFGAITGLPCDLRHVTISAGSVSMAMAADPAHALGHAGIAAGIGVLLVGTINILVGFTCALFTALRADGQPIRSAFPLLLHIARDAARRPLAYLLPVGGRDASVLGP